MAAGIRVGIDATNIRTGGGITHLVETLAHGDAPSAGIARISVWAPMHTLARLPERPWLVKRNHPWQDGPLPLRRAWQALHLDRALARDADVLLVPGGSYSGTFRPFVAMAQSLLPFDRAARRQYPLSWMRLRNWLLARSQGRTLRRADGAIFLTQYGRGLVERAIGGCQGRVAVIPLGATPGVRPAPGGEGVSRPFRWVYVSTVDMYKNHDVVLQAVAELHRRGLAATLDVVGAVYPPAGRRFERTLAALDLPEGTVRRVGLVPAQEMPLLYSGYDGAVFASGCESYGIPLVDGLGASLPTACARASTMPEIAGDAVEYFDPADAGSAAGAMARIMTDVGLRRRLAEAGPSVAARFDWAQGAQSTLSFLASFAQQPSFP